MSGEVSRAATHMALSRDRGEESGLKQRYEQLGIRTAAVDYGGDYILLLKKGVERAVVAAEREGLINPVHQEQGAVAGAVKEALGQIMHKAMGMSVGGKIGIARHKDHLAVAVFLGIGLLHFNEVAVALGHRTVPS